MEFWKEKKGQLLLLCAMLLCRMRIICFQRYWFRRICQLFYLQLKKFYMSSYYKRYFNIYHQQTASKFRLASAFPFNSQRIHYFMCKVHVYSKVGFKSKFVDVYDHLAPRFFIKVMRKNVTLCLLFSHFLHAS